jgi:hypothetical protein
VTRDEDLEQALFTAVLRYPLHLEVERGTAVVVLNSDGDNAQAGNIQAPERVYVGHHDTYEVALTRSGNVSDPAYVMVQSEDGSALAGVDYIHFDSFVYFEAGETEAVIEFDTLPVDSTRDFSIQLSSPMQVDFDNDRITVNITQGEAGAAHFEDADCTNLRLCASSQSIVASESGATTVPVELTRSGGTDGPLSVVVAYDEGSIDEETLEWSEQTVDFVDGQDSASFELQVPAGVTGDFQISVSTSRTNSYLDDGTRPALMAHYTITDSASGGQDGSSDGGTGEPDDDEHSSSSVHPFFVLLLLLATFVVQVRRRK